MVEITRPIEVKRRRDAVRVAAKRVKRDSKVSKITRAGPLVRVSRYQKTATKYKGLGYKVKKTDIGLTEYRAPKTVRYGTSYDRDAPRGTKRTYSYYSPKSVFVDSRGNIVKEVDRSTFKFDVGGGHEGRIFDAKVVQYGKVNGHTTKEEKTFREHDDKILPYQTNYYVDKTFVGRDWGTYKQKYQEAKQEKISKLQQERKWRKVEKKKRKPLTEEEKFKALYQAPIGAYDFSGVTGKESMYFGKELKQAFRQVGKPTPRAYEIARETQREMRPHPMSIQRPTWKVSEILRPTTPKRGMLSPDILKPTEIQQVSLSTKVTRPIEMFGGDLSKKIFGTTKKNNNKLKYII